MKSSKFSLADKIKQAQNYLVEKIPYKPVFIIAGFLATLWFLVRVIPKPSRAAYPCMRAAAPLMSGFVLYILSFTSSVLIFRKSKAYFLKKKYMAAVLMLVAGGIAATTFFIFHNQQPAFAEMPVMSEPPDGANNPMGVEQGVVPGRVVWAWNPEATNADCENVPGNAYWDYVNNDTMIIRGMVEESVAEVTGAENLQLAWDALFKNHNSKKYGEARGYQNGETIFLKINQGTASWLLTAEEKANGFKLPTSGEVQPSWRKNYFAATETGPFVVLNILRQLVNVAGVPQENIYIGDPMAHIYNHNFEVWYNEFPDVNYADKTTEQHHRTFIIDALDPAMHYSDNGEVLKETEERYFEEMQDANYMINFACLKSHVRAGITLNAKNHFGSITRSGAGHLHPGLVSTSDNGLDQSNTGYHKYRVLVDIMGHKYLGGNTMLYVIEGLFGGSENETRPPQKWNMEPFNGHWSSSIFMSADQVAIESVCYDFLRTEFNGINQPENYPNWEGVDDYLHQAADPDNWPEGFTYNPDGDGALKSLGIHEHWNDATSKQYSRNLGDDYGIELKQISGKLVSSAPGLAARELSLKTYPNPFSREMNISFGLEGSGEVRIVLYDLGGKQVEQIENRHFEAGNHEIQWNVVPGMKTGSYVLKIIAETSGGNFIMSQKVQLVK